MQETFKDIIGYEGLYQISNLGKVKSLERTKKANFGFVQKVPEMILKQFLVNGYPCVGLSKNNVNKTYKIHRLLGIHFIPNPENNPCVLHGNDIRTDFRIENLCWGTDSQNMKDKFRNGYKHSEKQKAVLEKRRVANSKIVLDTNSGIFYNSAKAASDAFGFNIFTLIGKLNGRRRNNTSLIYA